MNKFFTALLLLLVFTGCQKELTPSLSLSATQSDIANTDGKIEINVTCNTDWTATVSGTWCTISPSSGNGNAVITVSAANNFSDKSRSLSLNVTCHNILKTVLISQSYSQLSVDEDSLLYEKEVSAQSINITSNTKWQFDIPSSATWITVNPKSGEGNSTIALTAQTNTTGPARSADLVLKYADVQKIIHVSQARAFNTPPTTPEIITPGDKAVNVSTLPPFSWKSSTDVDNDAFSYIVYISKDNVNWKEYSTSSPSLYLISHLNENTTYSWKVKAVDYLGGASISPVYTFTTGLRSGLADGEYKIVQQAASGANGAAAEILVMGDGYVAADYQPGSLFDQNVQETINAFFSVEPYKSYKSYFRVYSAAAYSNESGATQVDKNIYKNTIFGTKFNGGSSISVETDAVFKYAKKISGVDDAKLRRMLIIVMVNQNRYAGTTFMWGDGKAIALCPLSRSTTEGTTFRNLIMHEAGGHGYGRLADEYINYEGKTIPESEISDAKSFISLGFYPNLDFTSDSTNIKWNKYFKINGYTRVGIYQGAYYYTYGAWRPESSSCMIFNEAYYNAPSRENMVKRIMSDSGKSFDFNTFVANDTEKAPATKVMAYSRSVNPLLFVPLAPPVYMGRR